MAEILSQEELEKLLVAINGEEIPEDFKPASAAKKVKMYDFARPGDPIDIYANNVLVAKGEVVVIDENLCVRITDLPVKEDETK
jgi:flagellar motor switch protein FliM